VVRNRKFPGVPAAPTASLGESFESFFDAVDKFVSNLASVQLFPLLLALISFTCYLTLRARASFNVLRAAYPAERIEFRRIWGAYFAGYGFNAVIPARGGDVVRLFLTKNSVPNSSYPAVAATFVVEAIFDVVLGSLMLLFAFTQGAFPKPPDFAKLNAFDLSYFAQRPELMLFVLTLAWRGWRGSRSSASASRRSGSGCGRASRSCSTATATSARCSSCSWPAGASGSRRSGCCSRPSTWAAPSGTCCWCWA
jgi:hypothetical protein